MDFSGQLDAIAKQHEARERASQEVLALRPRASKEIKRLLEQAVQYSISRRVASRELVLGYRQDGERVFEVQRGTFRKRTERIVEPRIVADVVRCWPSDREGRGWTLTDRAELVRCRPTESHEAGELKLAEGGTTRLSAAPEDIIALQRTVSSDQSTQIFQEGLPRRDSYGVDPDGRVVLISRTVFPHEPDIYTAHLFEKYLIGVVEFNMVRKD